MYIKDWNSRFTLHLHVWLWWQIRQFIMQQVACVTSVSMRFRGKERGTIFRAAKTENPVLIVPRSFFASKPHWNAAPQAIQQELFTITVLSQEKTREGHGTHCFHTKYVQTSRSQVSSYKNIHFTFLEFPESLQPLKHMTPQREC